MLRLIKTVLRVPFGMYGKVMNLIRSARLQMDILKAISEAYPYSLKSFPEKVELPPKYGRGLPERVIELLFIKFLFKPGENILDVGIANAMPAHLKTLKDFGGTSRIEGIDIADPKYNTDKYYFRFSKGDISRTEFQTGTFDQVWCISTLEHVGKDNSSYLDSFKIDDNMIALALKEMLRILKTGGTLLITLPYGKWEDHGWLINFDASMVKLLQSSVAGIIEVMNYYFKYTFGSGWKQVEPEELVQVGYYDQHNKGSGGVICMVITKRGE